MLEYPDALARVLAAVPPASPEEILLSDAHRRIAAERLVAPVDLPPFDNSSMDGYAVRAVDVAGARADSPVRLRQAGKVPAGGVYLKEMASGTCVRLFTGSPLPRGADAVVMQEDTRLVAGEEDVVVVLAAVAAGENVRCRGEDVSRGTTLVETGLVLSAGRISLLAAAGCDRILAGRQPCVGLLATGSELVEAGQPLARGQIYESNRLALQCLVAGAGGLPRVYPLVPDTLAATRQALERAIEACDVVVTSGGVSVGELDFVKSAFESAGGELAFWRVAIKPGRPFAFGRLGQKLLLGLPGNPVSAFVTFLLLVRPALRRWQGAVDVSLRSRPGVLGEALANPGPRAHFLRVKLDGAGTIRSAGTQASHILSSLANADGLVEVPPQTTLPAGAAVLLLVWDD